MTSWNSFIVHSSELSILSHIALNAANWSDDIGCPRKTYLGTGFSKLQWHGVWYLPSATTKSLMLKLKIIYMEFERDHIEEIFLTLQTLCNPFNSEDPQSF